MRLILAFLIAVTVSGPAARAQDMPLAQVMQAVRADEWDQARALAPDALTRDIIEWRYLRAGLGDLDQAMDFLSRNADWPGLTRIRARTEGNIAVDADPRKVLAYFKDKAPQTGAGATRLTFAYKALGQTADAQAQAVLTWRTMPLSSTDFAALLSGFKEQLAEHHVARLDEMLWQGAHGSARVMVPLVPEGWQKLAEARIVLRNQDPGVDARIEAVPAALQSDPGLAYERFRWRDRKDRDDDAAALMDERSTSADSLGQPERWAPRRRSFARRAMRAGDYQLAYRLAARHHLEEGSDFADLEWLSGFVALRFLDRPADALRHFQRFETAVETPISLGRAGYWQGRALEALGRSEEAQAAYAKGGAYQTGFYGQLAAQKAGMAMDPSLVGGAALPDWTTASFAGSDVLMAALKFLQAGEGPLAAWFLTHLAETTDDTGRAQLAGLTLSLEAFYPALRIAKEAAGVRQILPDAYFPVPKDLLGDHPVPTELVLAITRRESEFNPNAISGAGARGLMQLMPRTAQAVADGLEIEHRTGLLTADPAHNVTLGAAYLEELIEEFGLNIVLVSASYNAGPHRARRWIEANGDPRSAGVDVIDWIEMIPFNETRNYVMRVSESLAIYRARVKGTPVPITLRQELSAQ